LEVTSTTTTKASIESDPEVNKVIAVLKQHCKLESILEDDVGPRHERGLASDDELLDACSEIAASETDLFELAKLLLGDDPQEVDETDYEEDNSLDSKVVAPPESKAVEQPKSKVDETPGPSTDDTPASNSVPQNHAGSTSDRGPKVTSLGFVKVDWCDFKTSDGTPNWDEIQKFHDEITENCREQDAIKRILNLRDTPDIKQGGEVHHIIPRSLGGSNNKANLRRVETVKHIYLHGSLHVVSFNWQNAAAFAFMTDTRGKRTGMTHILYDEDLMNELAAAREVAREASSERMLKRWAQPCVREYMRQRVRDAMALPKVREAIRKFWADLEVRVAASARMRKIQVEKRAAENRDEGASKMPRCNMEGCNKDGTYCGMCRVHFRRAKDGEMSNIMKCKVAICNNGCRAGGLCCYHTAIQAEMSAVSTQLASVATSSRDELTELMWPTLPPLVLRSERLKRDGKWVCIVENCTTLARRGFKSCGKHGTIQRKIDATLAMLPPGLHEMTLPELQDAVSNALNAKLSDLEEKFRSPSPKSKGQHVAQLDPKTKRFLQAHENANKAGKVTGTTIGQKLKNANGEPVIVYSKSLKTDVCFRYATDEEAASIAPPADAVEAAKAAFESVAKRPSNKRHDKDAIPITQLDPKNDGAFWRAFGSISVAAEINGITNSLLQSKVKESHEKGEPYAELFAYSLDGTDAVKCWFRYATDEEAATIPPSMRKRRRGRRPKPAPMAASAALGETEAFESPATTSKPHSTSFQQEMKNRSTPLDEEVEWYSELASDDDESEFDGK
jgi:5-methylcytosine-specific restriction endonuclease McrA